MPFGEAAIKPAQRVVLTIDISGSMEGDRLQAAKDAAIAFLDAAPADAEVGLVLFNDTVAKVVPPTTDRAAVRTEVDAAVADGDTALYDAVIAGLDLLGEQGTAQLRPAVRWRERHHVADDTRSGRPARRRGADR